MLFSVKEQKGNEEANDLERSRNFQYEKMESTEISVSTEGLTESATGSTLFDHQGEIPDNK